MPDRPYVLLSVASSLDGNIDDTSDQPLALSNAEDFDRVDEVRAGVDAILVGANTVRRDNPRLLVRSAERKQARLDRGLTENPIKVTLTHSGDLDPGARFFHTGDAEKIVYTAMAGADKARERFAGLAAVVDAGDPLDLGLVLSDLAGRGVRRLMVEGGGTVHTWFLRAGLVDEIQLVVAPFLIGGGAAPRFVHDGAFPYGPDNPMTLAQVRRMGDVVLLRYLLERQPRTGVRGSSAGGT